MTQAEALKQAAFDIWLSMRRYNGKPDQVTFVGYVGSITLRPRQGA